MRKIGVLLLIICCLLCSITAHASSDGLQSSIDTTIDLNVVTSQENSAVASGSYTLDALNPILGTEKIVDNVRSAVVYEARSKTLMYAWNADAQMYPASLVKILTALVAIEKGTLSDTVTVKQSAISSVPFDAVSAKLLVGEIFTLEELLYCLVLGSANDAAAVIAEHISGSQSAFVQELNLYAENLGCTSTQFTNASGLHDDNQHTTARDSAKILDAALKNPVFQTIFTADQFTIPATNLSQERKLANGNSMKDTSSLLYYDSRVIGGRTGVTQDGRRCLATAAESNGMLIISVVMGAESVYQEDGYSAISIGGYKETTQLLDKCFDGYKTVQILQEDQVIRQVQIKGTKNALLIGPQSSVSTVLPLDVNFEDLSLRYKDNSFELPIDKGQHVSDLQIWNGNMCIAQVQLFAMNSLQRNDSDLVADANDKKVAVPVITWIILGIFILVVIVFLSLRYWRLLRTIIARNRKRRYRNGHKRVR